MGTASTPLATKGTTRGIRLCRVLYLFSGAQRKASVATFLQETEAEHSIHFELHEIDIQNSPDWDLADRSLQQKLLTELTKGLYRVVLITPPCSTWSRVRGANCRGPPPIRSREHPWGFPWLSKRHQKDADLGNVLIRFMLDVLRTLEQHPRSSDGDLVHIFAEHPEDLGAIWREEDGMKMVPASIWQLPELQQFVRVGNPLGLFTVVFNQCCWSAPYRKPTRLLSNLPALQQWGPCTWATFDGEGRYSGPAVALCRCKPEISLARTADDESFRTTATSIYPEPMDWAIAQAILQALCHPPSSPKEGVAAKRDGAQLSDRAGKKSRKDCSASLSKATLSSAALGAAVDNNATLNSEVDTALSNNATLSNVAGTTLSSGVRALSSNKATLSSRRSGCCREAEGLSSTGADRGRSGVGPPMQVKYKGELRSIHDGAGLCSPGRWPVDRRTAPRTEEGRELARWCFKAFEDWVELEGEEKAKRLFWQTAAGKTGGSPFGGEIYGFRERLDLWLRERGERPDRRPSDRDTEINFRRLMAVARVLEDEDAEFLEEVAAKGVPLGVDEDMPRNPKVYEEKVKWTVEQTEDDFQDTLADNYESAEENSVDIARQVREEVENGTILRLSEEEARRRFKGRLAVAALGAVPKELGTTRVRLIHDGTYSVDVNRRIRVRDRMRFPLIDDAAAILRQVESEKKEKREVVRFSVLYDIARAHKLVPVREEDWGFQAFRLPGETSGDVYVHTRGTFGVASAAYWFGRVIGVVVRCSHRLMGRHMGLLHLIYADDGWLTATGTRFWRKILTWLFIYELLEIPITWKKVRGGAEVDWIGYHLDVSNFTRGINESKRAWITKWIDGKLEQGGVLGRELKSVLGRLSFVAGALRHVRPFLAPLFSWSSSLAGGTFAKFPDAVVILLEFVREEVVRKPVRGLEPLASSPSDIFRVDAKAAGEEIVIGGWETWGGVPQCQARWFSFKLNRRNAAWAYLKGDPFRSIATLELIGVLAAVMVLSPDAKWAEGDSTVTLSALTDNLGNTHVLKKFGSSRYPLSIVAMELATQLDRRGIELDLQWVPRWQNQEADDLTNQRFDDFDEAHRIDVQFERLDFLVMGKLLEKAGKLDAELRLHKTSKEAKHAMVKDEAVKSKAKKGELRWKDPW